MHTEWRDRSSESEFEDVARICAVDVDGTGEYVPPGPLLVTVVVMSRKRALDIPRLDAGCLEPLGSRRDESPHDDYIARADMKNWRSRCHRSSPTRQSWELASSVRRSLRAQALNRDKP